MGKKAVKGSIGPLNLPIRIIMSDQDLERLWDLYFQDESYALDFWQQFRDIILAEVYRFPKGRNARRRDSQFFVDALKVLSAVIYDIFKNSPNLHGVVNVPDDERCSFFIPKPDVTRLTARCIQSVFYEWIAAFGIKDLDSQDDSFRVTYIQGGKNILRNNDEGFLTLNILRDILPHVETEQKKENIKSFDLITFALVLTSQGNTFLNRLKYPSV